MRPGVACGLVLVGFPMGSWEQLKGRQFQADIRKFRKKQVNTPLGDVEGKPMEWNEGVQAQPGLMLPGVMRG